MVLFHIDEGQNRPDLSPHPSLEAVNSLRAELTARAVLQGLDAGLLVTIYPEYADRLPDLVEFILRSEHVNYLLATPYVDIPAVLKSLRRDGRNGAAASSPSASVAPWAADRVTNSDIARTLRESLGLEPYAYLPSRLGLNGDKDFPNWLVYYIPVVSGEGCPSWEPRSGPAANSARSGSFSTTLRC